MTTGFEFVGERATGHVGHDHVGKWSGLVFIEGEDVGVIQTGDRLGFALKAQFQRALFLVIGRGSGSQDHLDSDDTVEVGLAGAIDRSEATLAK